MPCKCKKCVSHKTVVLDAYKLLHDMPGLDAGTVFVHDPDDHDKGSMACGSLKNAWDKGNCQRIGAFSWCAETHVLPGQLISNNVWFEQIHNDGRYHL